MTNEISDLNKVFWSELCGSQLAKELGVHDDSKASLAKFDAWFMAYYPYLYEYIPFSEMNRKKVLEVGLGYGTIAQKIAEAGAQYSALDIAEGPVNMVRHRLAQNELMGTVHQGSILDAPFEDDTFDWVVAIGCYHHTGDMQRAVDETRRILRPNGSAIIMVYNAFSYRRWLYSFSETLNYQVKLKRGDFSLFEPFAPDRGRYDKNSRGEAAPHTDFFAKKHIQHITKNWSEGKILGNNIGDEGVLRFIPRDVKLKILGRLFGLDLYCLIKK